jgi:2-keto-3-deoxy-galactonokinase
MPAEVLRLRACAAALTLLSGAVMMLAGYIGHTESWTSAGLITIPAGIAILAAFALARRADRADGRTVAPGPRRV